LEKTVSVTDIVQACKNNTSNCGELLALIELLRLNRFEKVEWIAGNRFHKGHYDIKCGNLKIEVKACNRDNQWAMREREKEPNFDSGFDRVNPKNFNYVICVSFNNELKDTKFFIFSSEESQKFEDSKWKSARGMKTIEVKKHKNDELNKIIASSRDAWSKIE